MKRGIVWVLSVLATALLVRCQRAPLPLAGEMTYMADAARFTECQTGRSYPIAMEADFVKMERSYLAAVKEPGARLYVTFEGTIADRPKMDGEGVEQTVVATRFIDVRPNQRCKKTIADRP